MTTTVISFFADNQARASFDNHSRYCAIHRYRHIYFDASASGWGHLRTLQKYQLLLRTLRESAEGDLVLLLEQDCLIVRDMPCEALMRDPSRNWILGTTGDKKHDFVLASFQLWRNSGHVRDDVGRLCDATKFGGPLHSESAMLRAFQPPHFLTQIDGCYAVAHAGLHVDPKWSDWPVFAIALGDIPDAPPNLPVFAGLRDLLARHINACKANGTPYLDVPSQGLPEGSDAPFESLRGDAPIALVMHYTPNIRCFGEIAERNLRRYCARHGYALHLYRDVPAEAGHGVSGTWLKPYVLLRHLPHHEWVFWVDADVLVTGQHIPLESLIEGRDRVLAMDMSWRFNAGIMGYRNTAENLAVLREVEQRILNVEDKSSTYASGGDQAVFVDVLGRHGMTDNAQIFDCLTLNTPYQLQNATSFMVHYMHCWASLRALIMDDADRASQMRDIRR